MPYKTIVTPAHVFLTHKGVSIFHTYKHDEVESGVNMYNFVLNKFHNNKDSFDVRTLPGWDELVPPPPLVGANDTTENKLAWLAWQKQGKEIKHIKKVIVRYINTLINEGYEPESIKCLKRMYNFEVKEIC